MKPSDNAKVMERLERTALTAYFEKLTQTEMRRLVLFPVFPYTAAANLSDPRPVIMIGDLNKLVSLFSGSYLN
jgi:hypothetical protein